MNALALKIEQMKQTLKGGGVAVSVASSLFPTPRTVAECMAELIFESNNWEPAPLTILEPSAGTGRLIEVCDSQHRLTAIEINYQLCMNLRRFYPTIDVHHGDFMDISPERFEPFDRVIMNPPFEKGQDVEHVKHAYNFLKVGGVLCSVMCEGPFFRSDNRSKDFRRWLKEIRAVDQKLPPNSFAESGTSVNTRLVIIKRFE